MCKFQLLPEPRYVNFATTILNFYVMFSHLIVTFLITARYKYSYLLTYEFLVDKYL